LPTQSPLQQSPATWQELPSFRQEPPPLEAPLLPLLPPLPLPLGPGPKTSGERPPSPTGPPPLLLPELPVESTLASALPAVLVAPPHA
jgi:hypothetical protein